MAAHARWIQHGGGAGGAEPPAGGTRAMRGGGAQRPWWRRAKRAAPRRYVTLPLFVTKAEGSHKMADSTKWRP